MKTQRLAYMALGAAIAFAGMIAATALNIGAQSSNPTHMTVESLTVVDKNGKRVLEIGVSTFGGGRMNVFGATGKPVVEIGDLIGVDSGGSVAINDSLGRRSIEAGHNKKVNAGYVNVFKAGTQKAQAQMTVLDGAGFVAVNTVGADTNGAIMAVSERGGAVLVISRANGKRAALDIINGEPVIGVWDENGKPLTYQLERIPGR